MADLGSLCGGERYDSITPINFTYSGFFELKVSNIYFFISYMKLLSITRNSIRGVCVSPGETNGNTIWVNFIFVVIFRGCYVFFESF